MAKVERDGSGQSYIEIPNGWREEEYIRITHVDRTDEGVGHVIRIQRHIKGKRPDMGPEMSLTKVPDFVRALSNLLREEGHTVHRE